MFVLKSSAVGVRLATPTAYKITPMIITTKREGHRCFNVIWLTRAYFFMGHDRK